MSPRPADEGSARPMRRATAPILALAAILTLAALAAQPGAPSSSATAQNLARAYLPLALRDADAAAWPLPTNPRATDRAGTAVAGPPATATPGAPLTLRVRRNQRYRDDLPDVDDALISLDLYTDAAARRSDPPRPLMVYVHGGGWQAGDKRSVGAKAEAFVAAGWVFASVNYRLSPAADFPAHAEDVAAAIAWLREQALRLNVDAGRMSLMGHSAGAHLVALVGADPRYLGAHGMAPAELSAVVPVDTQAYDIVALAAAQGGRLSEVYRQVFGESEEGWRFASPVTYVRDAEAGSLPPMAVAYSGGNGAPDRPSPLRKAMAEGFVAALRNAGGRTLLVPAPRRDPRPDQSGARQPGRRRDRGDLRLLGGSRRGPRTGRRPRPTHDGAPTTHAPARRRHRHARPEPHPHDAHGHAPGPRHPHARPAPDPPHRDAHRRRRGAAQLAIRHRRRPRSAPRPLSPRQFRRPGPPPRDLGPRRRLAQR